VSGLNTGFPLRWNRVRVVLQAGARDWWNEDAPVLGYLIKVLLASLLAMWLSLRFELDQPRTAMLTVAIVMQSRSGMVFAKSYYRLLGTLVGVLVSFLLVALFAQERVLFLTVMALWIGLCTAGSMIFRNHQSYAFVLAGYTLCIVGLPATLDPLQTFNIGVTRISEILVGLFSATLVSDLIFPQRLWEVMLGAVRRRFRDFCDLLRETESNAVTARNIQPSLMRFVGDVFSLESYRASAILENDESRRHRLRLNLMNNEFMQASTTLHAFHQLQERLKRKNQPMVQAELSALFHALTASVSLEGRSARDEHEAAAIVQQLAAYRQSLAARVASSRQRIAATQTSTERIAFETGVELLQRLADELYAYASTYAALGHRKPDEATQTQGEKSPRLEMHVDPLAVVLAGVRGALALAVLATIWILTDWRSGVEAITIGVITSTLFATSPTPGKTIRHFFIGAIMGTVLAYFCNFHSLTQAQGFWMLAMVVSPGILFATWLSTRPGIAIAGAGTAIIFLSHIGFGSAYSANPVNFMNDAIADLLAVLLSGVLYGLIDLSSSRWSRQRIAKALRNLVVSACRETLELRRIRLEASARDLVQRAGSAQRIGEEEDKVVVDWLFATLEIGHAVIALREVMQDIRVPSVLRALEACLEAVAVYHENPTEPRRQDAVIRIAAEMDRLSQAEIEQVLPQATRHKLLTMLYFIHSAMQDDGSVYAADAGRLEGKH
jgi:uncharacterized membrane protein YccC